MAQMSQGAFFPSLLEFVTLNHIAFCSCSLFMFSLPLLLFLLSG